jgi:hypothetical protein
MMTYRTLALRSLIFYARSHVAVLLGAAVALRFCSARWWLVIGAAGPGTPSRGQAKHDWRWPRPTVSAANWLKI